MNQPIGNAQLIEMVLDSSNSLEMARRLAELLKITDTDTDAIAAISWTIEAAENKAARRALKRVSQTVENAEYEIYRNLGNR